MTKEKTALVTGANKGIGRRGPRSLAQGAEIAVQLATLRDDGSTGGFFNDEGPQPW